MASRLFHGSRPNRQKERDEESAGQPIKTAKRTSIIAPSATVSGASKIPTHVSMFSRNKAKQGEEKEKKQVSIPPVTTTKPKPLEQRQKTVPAVPAEPSTSMPRGRSDFGFGVRTEVLGTPASTKSSPGQRNRLRRKASSNMQQARSTHSNTSTIIDEPLPTASVTTIETSSSPVGDTDPYPGSILGISLPVASQPMTQPPSTKNRPTAYATSSSRMATFISKQPPHKLTTQDLPPPTPNYAARSSSASTRYSGSPGPFSRTSTPTSASSHSPGIIQSSKLIPRLKTPSSPTRSRPPVTRRKMGVAPSEQKVEDPGLPPLRESSSSSSTVKAPEPIESVEPVQVGRGAKFNPPPPTPPLRLSSRRLPKPSGTGVAPSPLENSREAQSTRKIESASRPSFSESRPSLSEGRPSLSDSRIPAFGTARSRIPPPRPSREGTPRLESDRPSPVIQSNLSHIETTGHKRRESTEKALLTSPSQFDDQIWKSSVQRSPSSASSSSKHPQRSVSPGHARARSPHLYGREKSQTRENGPARTESSRPPPAKESNLVNESPNKSPSKFGFFNRRGKSPANVTAISIEKPNKKGPQAGTGHEGYGKYARRGRSGSIATSASRGRSTSTDRTSISHRPSSSRKSSFASDDNSELDDFYRDRLEPVVIGGGGCIRENRNSGVALQRTSSGESSASLNSSIHFGPPLPSKGQSRAGKMLTEDSSHATHQRNPVELMPPPKFGLPKRSLTPESSTLAHRRSLHRSQLFREAEPLKIPAPINTQASTSSAPLDSFDTKRSSIPYTDSSLNLTDDLSEGHEGNWLRSKKAKQRVKLPNKWNFFQRSQSSPIKGVVSESPQQQEAARDLPAAISKLPVSRSMPYYAMMDNSEPEDPDTLEDLLHNIEDDLELRNPENPSKAGIFQQTTPPREREYSILLPSPPKFPTSFTTTKSQPVSLVTLEQRPPVVEATKVQPFSGPRKRLQQVGRIPRVVSKRDRPHNPPPQSFSRPFVRKTDIAISPLTPDPVELTEAPSDESGTVVHTEPLPSAPWNDHGFDAPPRPPPTNVMLYNLDGEQQFLSFSTRQNSDVSGSSSSGVLSYAGMTAHVPRPNSLLKEDEVWNEYDELLDHVTSPGLVESSWPGREDIIDSFPPTSSSQRSSGNSTKKESPVLLSPRTSDSTRTPQSPRKVAIEDTQTVPFILDLPSPQRSDVNPSTPMLLSELYAGYGNRSSAMTMRQSQSSGSRYSTQSAQSKSGSQTGIDAEHIKRHTKEMAEKIKGSMGTPDTLRYSALMTARWLSFDRVLFSPVQEEIRNNRQDKVLVLDGLGNDDWSSYCALTYPDAIIYNLGTPRPSSGSKGEKTNWQPPPNHRQIQHASIAHPFPFPKGFFTAVVLRFPIATSEAALRNAVSECKRVLRPGGYLELCVLDMDMVNMGNRARRAVRELKESIQAADPAVSLSPTSDNIQKMLGRRGFENLNRCVVGVPVTGTVSDSGSGSETQDDKHSSLGDMLRDAQAGGTVPVAKMIAKVGRWWWSQCYERSISGEDGTEESVWNDKALLRECENRDTGFRLVICYAQKPLNVRRRTVSV